MKKLNIIKCISCMDYFDKNELEKFKFGIEFQDFTNVNIFNENWSEILNFYLKNLDSFKGIKSMHGPFIDLKPYSYDTYIRQNSITKYKMAMNMAAVLGLDFIIFHSQINPFVTNRELIELDNKYHGEIFNSLVEEFHNYRGTILIENVYESNPESLKELIDNIDNDRVKINFDVGHGNLSKTHSLEDWIKILGEDIRYCHLHFNQGEKDSHARPSSEELYKVLSLFDKYNINVPISLEYFPKDLNREVELFKSALEKGDLNFEI